MRIVMITTGALLGVLSLFWSIYCLPFAFIIFNIGITMKTKTVMRNEPASFVRLRREVLDMDFREEQVEETYTPKHEIISNQGTLDVFVRQSIRKNY